MLGGWQQLTASCQEVEDDIGAGKLRRQRLNAGGFHGLEAVAVSGALELGLDLAEAARQDPILERRTIA